MKNLVMYDLSANKTILNKKHIDYIIIVAGSILYNEGYIKVDDSILSLTLQEIFIKKFNKIYTLSSYEYLATQILNDVNKEIFEWDESFEYFNNHE